METGNIYIINLMHKMIILYYIILNSKQDTTQQIQESED